MISWMIINLHRKKYAEPQISFGSLSELHLSPFHVINKFVIKSKCNCVDKMVE